MCVTFRIVECAKGRGENVVVVTIDRSRGRWASSCATAITTTTIRVKEVNVIV
jgi:hypothetical protein